MPTLSITKTYQDGDVLFEADLDNIKNDIETFLNTTKIDDDNIQDAGITASSKIIDATITTGKLGAASVTTAKIADSAVTTGKINDLAVTTAKINDSAVTTAKINDSAVTTAKIADGAVTYVKRVALNYKLSNSSASFSTSSTSYTAVTNLSVSSLTTNGRPVYVTLVPAEGSLSSFDQTGATGSVSLQLVRSGAVNLGEQTFILSSGQSSGVTPSWVWIPTAGTYDLSISIKVSAGTIGVTNYKLFCYEL